jgi:hypothetical protein
MHEAPSAAPEIKRTMAMQRTTVGSSRPIKLLGYLVLTCREELV